jgi:hypothetical protein
MRFSLVLVVFALVACGEERDPNITPIPQTNPAQLAKAYESPVASSLRNVFAPGPSMTGGLTSASIALRSLGDDPGDAAAIMKRRKIGVMGKIPGGLTLDQLAEHIAADSGRKTEALRPESLDVFRAALIRATGDTSMRVLVNYNRKLLFGVGGGHHAIVGAVLPDDDLVLILDPDPAYGAFLVPMARLFEATRSVDTTSKNPRGVVVIGQR